MDRIALTFAEVAYLLDGVSEAADQILDALGFRDVLEPGILAAGMASLTVRGLASVDDEDSLIVMPELAAIAYILSSPERRTVFGFSGDEDSGGAALQVFEASGKIIAVQPGAIGLVEFIGVDGQTRIENLMSDGALQYLEDVSSGTAAFVVFEEESVASAAVVTGEPGRVRVSTQRGDGVKQQWEGAHHDLADALGSLFLSPLPESVS